MLFFDDTVRDALAPMIIGISAMLAFFAYMDYRRGRTDSAVLNTYASVTALSDPFIAGAFAWLAMFCNIKRTRYISDLFTALMPSTVTATSYISQGMIYL